MDENGSNHLNVDGDSAPSLKKPKLLLPNSKDEEVVTSPSLAHQHTTENNDYCEDDDDEEDYYEDEEEDDDSNSSDEELQHSNGKADRKGKGILIEDQKYKGKGKLVDDSDDDSSCSDLCEDPLAEVDLDNILPSRTRRSSSAGRGVHISNNAHRDSSDADA